MAAEYPTCPERSALIAIVAARNEADRIGATLAALARGARRDRRSWVADDGSTDGTARGRAGRRRAG